MKRLLGIALGGCALAALVLFTGTPAEAKCGKASASGVGLGPEMAKDMAKMNLAAGLESKKLKAKGKVAYACSGPLMSECKASQRAC
jgi:hypothetical protein